MFNRPWSAWRRRATPLLAFSDRLTNALDLTKVRIISGDDMNSARELIHEQIKLERELEIQQWHKADLLQDGDYALRASRFGFGAFFYQAAVIDWVECASHIERAVRDVDDRITSIKACLRILNRRIQTILGVRGLPSFLRAIVVVQSRFYIFHGNHPPRLSGSLFFRPTQLPGASLA